VLLPRRDCPVASCSRTDEVQHLVTVVGGIWRTASEVPCARALSTAYFECGTGISRLDREGVAVEWRGRSRPRLQRARRSAGPGEESEQLGADSQPAALRMLRSALVVSAPIQTWLRKVNACSRLWLPGDRSFPRS
jgi:hypothetical protein